MSNRTAQRRSPRDLHAWMRTGLAGLIVVTVATGVTTVILGWQMVAFNFTVGMTVLAGVPIIMELLRTRPTPDDIAHNESTIRDIIADFEEYLHH